MEALNYDCNEVNCWICERKAEEVFWGRLLSPIISNCIDRAVDDHVQLYVM
jgi:hypothetical protein